MESGDEEFSPIACTQCRSRHKKCDKKLPKCTYCNNKGLDCEYVEPKQKGRKKQKPLSPYKSDIVCVASQAPSTATNTCESSSSSSSPPPNNNQENQPPVEFIPSEPKISEIKDPEIKVPECAASEISVPEVKHKSTPIPGTSVIRNRSFRVEPYPTLKTLSNRQIHSYQQYFNQERNYPLNPSNDGSGFINFVPIHPTTQPPRNMDIHSTDSVEIKRPNTSNVKPIKNNVRYEAEYLRSIRKDEVKSWTCSLLAAWIDSVEPIFASNHVGETFMAHDIDGSVLLCLDVESIKDMGITKVGVIIKLCKIIEQINSQSC